MPSTFESDWIRCSSEVLQLLGGVDSPVGSIRKYVKSSRMVLPYLWSLTIHEVGDRGDPSAHATFWPRHVHSLLESSMWRVRKSFYNVKLMPPRRPVRHTKHPIDQTSICWPYSILNSVERWLTIVSGARTASGVRRPPGGWELANAACRDSMLSGAIECVMTDLLPGRLS